METEVISKEPYYLSPPYRGWPSHTAVEHSADKLSDPHPSSPTRLPMHLQDHSQPWARHRHRRPSSLSTHTYNLRSPTSQSGRQSPIPSPPKGCSRLSRNCRPPPLAIPSPTSSSSGSRTSTPWYLTTATPRSAKTFDSWPTRSPGAECISLDTLNRNGPDYRRWSHSYYWYDNPSSSSQSSLASTPTSANRVCVHRYQPRHYSYSGRSLPGYATPIRTQHYIVRCMWMSLCVFVH